MPDDALSDPLEPLTIPIGFLIELSHSTDRDSVFEAYARWVKLAMETDQASVALAEGDALRLFAIQGNRAVATGTVLPVEGTLLGHVLQSRASATCLDTASRKCGVDCQLLAAGGLASVIAAPLAIGLRCFGALAVAFEDPAAASGDKVLILEAMAGCLASYMLLHEQLQQASRQALTDPLTQVYNRRFFQQYTAEAWARWQRTTQTFSIALIDLDHFKRINDTHGHDFGDEVLRAVAETVQALSRPDDLLVRMGGEEFCLVLPGTSLAAAQAVAERIRAAIAAMPLTSRGAPVRVTASIGVAAADGRHGGLRALTMAADDALYRAKNAGRDRVVAAV